MSDKTDFRSFSGNEALQKLLQQAKEKAAKDGEPAGSMSRVDMAELVYDLRVHQIELEMQNEELQRANAEIDHVRAQYQELWEHSPVGYLTLNPAGRVAAVNQAGRQLLGLSEGSILEEQFITLIVPEDRVPVQLMLEHAMETGTRGKREITITPPHGRVVYCQLECNASSNGDHQRLIRVVLSDITEARKVKEELKAAKVAADAANQAKSLFLANMSHEIRTPISGMIGMVDLSLDETSNSRIREYLGYARQSAQHLLVIINDILDLSRIESGKMALTRAPFSLTEMLDDVLTQARLFFTENKAGLDYRLNPAIPEQLVGDRYRLRQILMNLIGNAVKFTEKGDISVSVDFSGRTGSDDQVKLLFSVKDTGIGIPADRLSSIFESFEQLDTDLHVKSRGVGLGLAIVKKLVTMMGGDIWVESRENTGSTFYFTADFGVSRGLDNETPLAPACACVPPLRILLAEDEAINRMYMSALLKSRGHEVLQAKDGQEALNLLAGNSVDLVLMDIQMPKMTGDEAVRRIRTNPPAGVDPRLPVVALTAYSMKNEIEKYQDSGFDAYLTKPVEEDLLEQILSELYCNR